MERREMPPLEVVEAFADGRYTFRLGLAQLAAIQAKCGPIGQVFARVIKGRYVLKGGAMGLPEISLGEAREAEYRIEDLVETIRQGLIGGRGGVVDGAAVEVNAAVADRLIETYVTAADVPVRDLWDLAYKVLERKLEGFAAEVKQPPGKGLAPEQTTGGSTTPAP